MPTTVEILAQAFKDMGTPFIVGHPGGESVRASDRNIAIKHYDGPDDIAGREPLPAEIEGKRLPVYPEGVSRSPIVYPLPDWNSR